MSVRLLLAINDAKVAEDAAAMAHEGDEIEVVQRTDELDRVVRALPRLEPDVLVIHDRRGAVPVLELTREVCAAFPHIGVVVIIAEPNADLTRAAMQAGARDAVPLPLSLEELHNSVLVAAEWSRTMRGHFGAEAEAATATGLSGRIVALAGAKGGTGTTTLAVHLALHAAVAEPDHRVCLVDFDLQAGDVRTYLNSPHRRSIVDLVTVAGELSVRHMDETLYEHSSGVRVLLAPAEGEHAEDVTEVVARNVLGALRARHDLTIVDLGATVLGASIVVCEMADEVLVVTTPDVPALRGAQRLIALWERLQVAGPQPRTVLNRASRKRVVQPDVVRSFVGDTLCKTSVPADFEALEPAINTGMPERLEDRRLRAAIASLGTELELFGAMQALPLDEGAEPEPRGLVARLTNERGQSTVEFMGLLPIVALVALLLWQMGLLGYTYMSAGNAAREGARELAVGDPAPPAIRAGVPASWRDGLRCTVGETRVRVSLAVPVVLPGLDTPLRIGSSAGTSAENAPVGPIERSLKEPETREENACRDDRAEASR